jgi:hypothetical protein
MEVWTHDRDMKQACEDTTFMEKHCDKLFFKKSVPDSNRTFAASSDDFSQERRARVAADPHPPTFI